MSFGRDLKVIQYITYLGDSWLEILLVKIVLLNGEVSGLELGKSHWVFNLPNNRIEGLCKGSFQHFIIFFL